MSSGVDRPEEQLARAIMGEVTGAHVILTDDSHAPAGTVDARLDYPDGRTGALEISRLVFESELEAESRIAALGGRLQMPGRWKWVVSISHARELARIQKVYAKAVLTCGSHNVASPSELPTAVVEADRDLEWLSTRSTSRLCGIQLPEGAQDMSGFIDLNYQPADPYRGYPGPDGIVSELNAALGGNTLARRVTKLLRADGDERHLFLHVAVSGLDEYSYARLIANASVPQSVVPLSGDPDLPEPISHFWLYTGWFNRVSRWTRGQGWDHPQLH
ncbi:hypothetical protein [Promicromonospora soli]